MITYTLVLYSPPLSLLGLCVMYTLFPAYESNKNVKCTNTAIKSNDDHSKACLAYTLSILQLQVQRVPLNMIIKIAHKFKTQQGHDFPIHNVH